MADGKHEAVYRVNPGMASVSKEVPIEKNTLTPYIELFVCHCESREDVRLDMSKSNGKI